MKLNFNLCLTNLKGETLKNGDGSDAMMNATLATALVSSTGKENITKIFDWALTLQKNGILDLDRADQSLLKGIIQNSDTLYILAKGRMLEVFEKPIQDDPK